MKSHSAIVTIQVSNKLHCEFSMDVSNVELNPWSRGMIGSQISLRHSAIRPALNPMKMRRVVVKIGSSSITNESGIDNEKIDDIIADCHKLLKSDCEVVLVSSGAVQAGSLQIKCKKKKTIDYMQAASAVGQPLLMHSYDQSFRAYGYHCGQVLVTHDDFRERQRYLNIRNTINRLIKAKTVPIINENDSVSFSEITVGDNDQLAAMVTEMIGADALVILTEPEGLFTGNPADTRSKLIEKVPYGSETKQFSTTDKSSAGRGGMVTKLEAVNKVVPLGIPVIISTYKKDSPIYSALDGSGTYFEPNPSTEYVERDRWLVASAKVGAQLQVDEVTHKAIQQQNSLRPSGVIQAVGDFRRGDCISISCRNKIFAMGLIEYNSKDVHRILSKKTSKLKSLFRVVPAKCLIRRNNLVTL